MGQLMLMQSSFGLLKVPTPPPQKSLSVLRTANTTPRSGDAILQTKPRRLSSQEMESKVILDDVDAVFKPSTTTLVLGPPGCGKVLEP